jgi:hypothetical protein
MANIGLLLLAAVPTAASLGLIGESGQSLHTSQGAYSGSQHMLGETWFTPHKTGSDFLQTVIERLSWEVGACSLNDMNCQVLENNPLCARAVRGAVSVPHTAWGADCTELYSQVLSGRADKTVLDFDATPFMFTHRDERQERQYPSGDLMHESTTVWHHRHPFDAECSAYVSFGWHHVKSPYVSQQDWDAFQQNIQSMGVDQYVEMNIQSRIDYMKNACEQIQGGSGTHILSSYEDMVSNFTDWLLVHARRADRNNLGSDNIVSNVIQSVKPEFHSDGDHLTHVQPGRYLEELAPETIEKLRGLVRSSVPDDCLCGLMKYDDFCKAESRGKRAIDPVLKEVRFDD